MRSLVVEDSPASRALLKRLLSEFGECMGVDDGLAALEVFTQAVSGEHDQYDLVCLDLELPGIDGLELLSRIRQVESAQGARPTKVFIITGSGDESTVKKVSELRVDGYLLKPIDSRKLRKLLQELGLAWQSAEPVVDPAKALADLCDADALPVPALARLIERMVKSIERQSKSQAAAASTGGNKN